MKARRHPVRGFFAGLFLGGGVAWILFALGVVPFTVAMLGIVTLVGILLGIGLAYVAPVRGGDAAPPATT